MLAGQALATKSDNALAQNRTSLPRAVLGPRRAVGHGVPILLEAFNPARHDLGRGIDAGGLHFGEVRRRQRRRPFLSTQRGQSGILMDVQLGAILEN
jgi:hypothetical protein